MNDLYEILPYSIGAVCACINDFTDTPISVIKRKPFINYLDFYINDFSKCNNTRKTSILLEKEYIDRFFLQDYSNYYVKCFNHYKRDCMRIHFFLCDEEDLKDINGFGDCQTAVNSYLGFVVIRPMQDTFVARACLKKNHGCSLISKTVVAHLKGLDFSVETIPFIEQDHVLSVCATSALWSFFSAHANINKNCMLSPFQITATAMNTDMVNLPVTTDINAQLNSGLTIDMMCNCIKTFGLVPQFYALQEKSQALFYELIHVFVSSGFPVILGVVVYDIVHVEKGLHAVVVLGDEIGDIENFNYNNVMDDDVMEKFPLHTYAHNLSRLYVHDDRIGPYTRLEYRKDCWALQHGCDSEISPENHTGEYYKPTDIVIGLYPKVRLPFLTVWNFAYYLNKELNNLLEKRKKTDAQAESMQFMGKIKWDFRLEDNSVIKKRIRNSNAITECKDSFLKLALPRYCWCVKAFFDTNIIFEVIIDSTELPQGKYVISLIYYDDVVKTIFINLKEYFEAYIKTDGGDAFTSLIQHDLWALYKWFNPEQSIFNELDYKFGETKIPRYFKSNEYRKDEIKNQKPMIITSKMDVAESTLDEHLSYIWAISKDGFLLIGTEDKDDKSDLKGHPTLLQGRVGRIAGELHFDNENKKWKVNTKSGRYSYAKDDARRYANNAITERFSVFFDKFEFEYEDLS